MFGGENLKVLTLLIDTDPTGEEEFFLAKMPRAATVTGFHVVSEQAQNAGTAALFRLENWGTAGTAVEGTICAYVGGTANDAQIGALVPAAGVINTSQAALDEGDWLVMRYNEEGAGWIANDRFTVVVQYVDGKAV